MSGQDTSACTTNNVAYKDYIVVISQKQDTVTAESGSKTEEQPKEKLDKHLEWLGSVIGTENVKPPSDDSQSVQTQKCTNRVKKVFENTFMYLASFDQDTLAKVEKRPEIEVVEEDKTISIDPIEN
ncbi:hypothetical protein H4219_002072 [Mycoemilia scoparia]|uniref:Inhibitor I9 domain-containing protein n=1 Tax=Mycoemilia scoparia TaxID=417184 RepID=A0A9W8DUX2_9FUNG|nr:hypothetical protein H4219_002072 [Mycoemilia scoparia]